MSTYFREGQFLLRFSSDYRFFSHYNSIYTVANRLKTSGKLSENGQKIAIFAEFPNLGQHHCHIIAVECRIFAESLIEIIMSLFVCVISMLYICIHNNNKWYEHKSIKQ